MISDFAIQVRNLPPDGEYEGNEEILRAQLADHFRGILFADGSEQDGARAKQAAKKNAHEDIENLIMAESRMPSATPDADPGHDLYEIVDVSFGKARHENTEALVKLYDLYKEIEKYKINKISRFASSREKEQFRNRL